jgi:AhpD family alkylhydroperoxidase
VKYRSDIDAMRSELRILNRAIPEIAKGYATLSTAAKESGVLGVKEKEFIALGIAVATHCQPCINFHVDALMKAGANREELGDVLAMAIQMGGGPALMYSAHALACWDELAVAKSYRRPPQ